MEQWGSTLDAMPLMTDFVIVAEKIPNIIQLKWIYNGIWNTMSFCIIGGGHRVILHPWKGNGGGLPRFFWENAHWAGFVFVLNEDAVPARRCWLPTSGRYDNIKHASEMRVTGRILLWSTRKSSPMKEWSLSWKLTADIRMKIFDMAWCWDYSGSLAIQGHATDGTIVMPEKTAWAARRAICTGSKR